MSPARHLSTGRLLAAGVVLALGLATWWAAATPLSQPAWPRPAGADPAPEPVAGTPTGRQGPLVVALAGDAMVGRGIARRLQRQRAYDPWRDLGPALAGADLLVTNLETAITDVTDEPGWKPYRFRLPGALAAQALDLPVPALMASVANNHVLDHGPAGLLDTLRALDALGVARAGAGADAREAHAPAVRSLAGGVRVGLLALADHCGCLPLRPWIATAEAPGIWHENLSWGQRRRPAAHVANLAGAVDLVVVAVHGGSNYPAAPAAWMRDTSRVLVEAGADLVVWTSAHTVLPVEVVEGRHVFYGLGDLVHDYAEREDPPNDLALVARVHVDESGGQVLEPVPIRVVGGRAVPLDEGDPNHARVLARAGLSTRAP